MLGRPQPRPLFDLKHEVRDDLSKLTSLNPQFGHDIRLPALAARVMAEAECRRRLGRARMIELAPPLETPSALAISLCTLPSAASASACSSLPEVSGDECRLDFMGDIGGPLGRARAAV
jgi:hypothetical protein